MIKNIINVIAHFFRVLIPFCSNLVKTSGCNDEKGGAASEQRTWETVRDQADLLRPSLIDLNFRSFSLNGVTVTAQGIGQ